MKHQGPHKYKRLKMGRGKDYIVFRCDIPGCPHYVPRDLVTGRETICWKCGKTFIMSTKDSHHSKPSCGCLSFRQERLAGMDIDALLKGK